MPLPCISTSGGPSPASRTRTVTEGSARRTRRLATCTPHAANSRLGLPERHGRVIACTLRHGSVPPSSLSVAEMIRVMNRLGLAHPCVGPPVLQTVEQPVLLAARRRLRHTTCKARHAGNVELAASWRPAPGRRRARDPRQGGAPTLRSRCQRQLERVSLVCPSAPGSPRRSSGTSAKATGDYSS